MSKKALKYPIPNLARAYIDAHRVYAKTSVYVPRKTYAKFVMFEFLLRDLDISNKHYAGIVTQLLRTWCKKNRLSHVPINVFTGEWAFSRYLQILDTKSVDLVVNDDGELLHSELMVARLYIANYQEGCYTSFGDAVEDISGLLSEKWLKLYYSKGDRPSKIETLAILAKEYGVLEARSYKELADHVYKS